MGTLLLIIGAGMLIVGNIWLLVETFRTSLVWGLGTLLVPVVGLVFVAMHWGRCWPPFVLTLVGCALIVGGMAIEGPALGSD